jgi:hypothetical protein
LTNIDHQYLGATYCLNRKISGNFDVTISKYISSLLLSTAVGTCNMKAREDSVSAEQWDKFLSVSQFDKTTEEVVEAARDLGLKMKAAYDSAKKSVG